MRWTPIAALLFIACSSPPPAPPPAPTARPAPPPPVAMTKCPEHVDVGELLVRHAKKYGDYDAIAKGLPWSLRGEIDLQTKKGVVDVVLADEALRSTALVSGLFVGNGIDRQGAWVLSAGAGVVERLTGPGEDADAHFEAWLFRRGYLRGHPDAVKCVDESAGPRVDLDYRALGTLSFDLLTAALLSASHRVVDGRSEVLTFESWHEQDKAQSFIRWPKKVTSHPSGGNVSTTIYEKAKHGLACTRRGPGGAPVPEQGDACARAPEGAFAIQWPASGRTRIPMKYVRRSLLVHANVGGRDVPALLDSGAGVTVVDATTPAGRAFVPTLDVEGASATQKLKIGFGELPSVTLGDVVATNVPCASVPIPALDDMGKGRPEAILGYSFFAASVARIDYRKSEIVLAKPGTTLAAADARSIPLRVASGKLLAEATIEGTKAWFEIDTGNTGGLDPYGSWEKAHGLPGDRPTTTAVGRFSAGTQETPARFYRLKSASLGPIVWDGGLVHDSDPPDTGDIAGLVGNSVFAKCDAIVIDHDARKMSFEGPCTRVVRESMMPWRLGRKDATWVVDVVVPGSSVDRAGIEKGDVVVEIAGKPVSDDPAVLEAVETQPEGTKVPIVVLRDGKKQRIVVELKKLLP